MDQKVKIKEEPVWLEGTASASLDNYDLVSEMIHLKEETKSELVEPGQMQVNTFEPFADVKDEILVDEHTVCQLDPCFREEDNVENLRESMLGPLVLCDSSCNELETGNDLMCNLPSDVAKQPHRYNESGSHRSLGTKERPFQHFECHSTLSLKSNVDSKPSSISGKSHCGYLLLSQTLKHDHSYDECGKRIFEMSTKSPMVTNSTERPYTCNICGKMFANKYYLKGHILTHSQDSPNVCNECGKTFSMKAQVLSHMLSHSGKRPHVCNLCGKRFSMKTTLKYHSLTHSGERLHVCNICGKRFSRRSILGSHLVTHSRERLFECHDCGRTFASKDTLRCHILSQSVDHTLSRRRKPTHMCSKCGSMFYHKSTLSSHINSDCRKLKYCCRQCGTMFSYKSNLNRHMLIHSRDAEPSS